MSSGVNEQRVVESCPTRSGQYLQSFAHTFDTRVLNMSPRPPFWRVTGYSQRSFNPRLRESPVAHEQAHDKSYWASAASIRSFSCTSGAVRIVTIYIS